MSQEISAGFILFQKGTDRLLVCHPNGNPSVGRNSWDIPKGHIENGEKPLEAALRELREETGITTVEDVYEIGRVPYRSGKALYLFDAYAEFDIADLECTSRFVDSYGVWKREIDSFMLTDEPEMLFRNMYWYATRAMARRGLAKNVVVELVPQNSWGTTRIHSIISVNSIREYLNKVEKAKDMNWWNPNGEFEFAVTETELFGPNTSSPDKVYRHSVLNSEVVNGLLGAKQVVEMNPLWRKFMTMHPFPFEEWIAQSVLPPHER